MAEHIPFITSRKGALLAKQLYHDSSLVRVPLLDAKGFLRGFPSSSRVWLDPGVDGMDDLGSRTAPWLRSMRSFPNFDKVGDPSFHAKPVASEVDAFVEAVMDACATHEPEWITVPQIPFSQGAGRNRINLALARSTGRWRSQSAFPGRLILPLVITHQGQVNGKTARNPKVKQAGRCYEGAQADGFWVVDKSLKDDDGSCALRNRRFRGVIDFHRELNQRVSSDIKIAGPYWALNLVLWGKGLVDYPAIGIGGGYQFLIAGGHVKVPGARLALPCLRRRVGVSPQLKSWLSAAAARLSPSHPAHAEFRELRKHYVLLSPPSRAKEQVAKFYKQWFDLIASVPKAGRSMALFQDLAAAYALGKSLPDLKKEGTVRKPEAVAEPLMLSCL